MPPPPSLVAYIGDYSDRGTPAAWQREPAAWQREPAAWQREPAARQIGAGRRAAEFLLKRERGVTWYTSIHCCPGCTPGPLHASCGGGGRCPVGAVVTSNEQLLPGTCPRSRFRFSDYESGPHRSRHLLCVHRTCVSAHVAGVPAQPTAIQKFWRVADGNATPKAAGATR